MQRLSEHLRPLVFGLGISTIVLVVVLLAVGSGTARDSFWSQLAATLSAVIVGVPVALWLAWWQQQAERDTRDDETVKRRSRAADDLLAVIAADLKETRAAQFADVVGPTADQAHAPPSVSSLLDHLGGDRLSVIDDPETISVVSRAYDHIATWRHLRGTLYEVGLDSFAGDVEHVFKKRVREHLFDEQSRSTNAINDALQKIDAYRAAHVIKLNRS